MGEDTEQAELARVIAVAEGWDLEDLTPDFFEDYLQTAAEVLAAGYRKEPRS
jgi:hypothetical protein